MNQGNDNFLRTNFSLEDAFIALREKARDAAPRRRASVPRCPPRDAVRIAFSFGISSTFAPAGTCGNRLSFLAETRRYEFQIS